MKFLSRYFINIVLFLILVGFSNKLLALEPRPTLFVPAKGTVSVEVVKLKDVATIKDVKGDFQEAVNKISEVNLGVKLRPRESATLKGTDIIKLISASGIDIEVFGYSIPVDVTITRQGDILSKEQVLSELKLQLHGDPNLDLQVKDVSWDTEQVVATKPTSIKAELLGEPVSGKLPLRLSVFENENLLSRFLATATVDDWRAIPILKSKLDRGSLIRPEDIQIIRANTATLPQDISFKSTDIVGRRVTRAIASGEPIRKIDIDIPPIIEKGKQVSVIYSTGGFTAKATAIALKDGHEGEIIELRNDRSQKIVKASVVTANEVKVIQ